MVEGWAVMTTEQAPWMHPWTQPCSGEKKHLALNVLRTNAWTTM